MAKKKSLTPEADSFRKALSKLETRISNALLGAITSLKYTKHPNIRFYNYPHANNPTVAEGPIVEIRFEPSDQTEYGIGGDDFVRGVALVDNITTVGLIIGNNSGPDEEYRLTGDLDVDMLKLIEALGVLEKMAA